LYALWHGVQKLLVVLNLGMPAIGMDESLHMLLMEAIHLSTMLQNHSIISRLSQQLQQDVMLDQGNTFKETDESVLICELCSRVSSL
jgi:hypothetical protein